MHGETAFSDLGTARVDIARTRRTGVPEVVFAAGKTLGQTESVLRELVAREGFALATRIPDAAAGAVLAERLPDAVFDAGARALRCGRLPRSGRTVAVVCAGTSDVPVADEAAFTLDAFGHEVVRRSDVGVAGIHRLFADFDEVAACDVCIVAAGMEGALPSVVAGLVHAPVIAVPTSVGYGVAAGGYAALLAMLASCAPGIAVVNIDNGFGAAALAHKMLGIPAR
ncbi:MAG: nickel pincer cofactor biosynthesis protein LarB [Candidatus Velthaea sp.]